MARHLNRPGTHGQRKCLETERSWSVGALLLLLVVVVVVVIVCSISIDDVWFGNPMGENESDDAGKYTRVEGGEFRSRSKQTILLLRHRLSSHTCRTSAAAFSIAASSISALVLPAGVPLCRTFPHLKPHLLKLNIVHLCRHQRLCTSGYYTALYKALLLLI